MLCISGFELYSRWVPLKKERKKTKKQIGAQRMILSDLQRWLSFS